MCNVCGFIRSAEMLHAWSTWDAETGFDELLQKSRRALSLFQHHDGITGTERDHVVQDYDKQMLEALSSCKFIIQQCAYRYLTKPSVCSQKTKYSDDITSYAHSFMLHSISRYTIPIINSRISTLMILVPTTC